MIHGSPADPYSGSKYVTARIFLALDNRVLRESLARLLRNSGKGCVEVCGVSPCTMESNDLLETIAASNPDVIVTEANPSPSSRGGFLRRVLSLSGGAKTLIVDLKGDDQSFLESVRAGATGFL